MIAVLTSDLVEASRQRIERWTETEGIATPDDFLSRRERLPGDLVSFTETGKRLYRELKDFVYRHVIHSFPVSRTTATRGASSRGLPRLPREPAAPAGFRALGRSPKSSACAFSARWL